MRVLALRQPNLLVYLVSTLLLSILLLTEPSSSSSNDSPVEASKSSSNHEPSAVNQPENPKLELRNPVETPPTEYLPYPPPPNYNWPAGENPNNQNPKPSEPRPTSGWYAGQSGSNSGSGSGSSSSSSPSLRSPLLFQILASLLPARAVSARLPRISSQKPLTSASPFANNPLPPAPAPSLDPQNFTPSRNLLSRLLRLRTPVETPPTEYLPYPPPPNYSWPAGYSPSNENPPPSEFDPPAGWYGGTGQTVAHPAYTARSGSGGGYSGNGGGLQGENGGLVKNYGGHANALPAGTIAAIAIPVGLALIAALTLLAWWLRRRNANKKGTVPPAPGAEDAEGEAGGAPKAKGPGLLARLKAFWAAKTKKKAAPPGEGAPEMGQGGESAPASAVRSRGGGGPPPHFEDASSVGSEGA